MKNLYCAFPFFLFPLFLFSQEANIDPDTIWQNILEVQNDSSLSAFNYREEQAQKLYEHWQKTKQNKALVFAFGAWLSDKNYYKILRTVETLDLDSQAWEMTFLFYRKAFLGICGYCFKDYIEQLDRWLAVAQKDKTKATLLMDKALALQELSLFEQEKAVYDQISALDLPASDRLVRRAQARSKTLNRLTGTPAPLFTVTTSSGEKLSLDQLKGKVVFLHFWATWCKPCLEELPLKRKWYEEYGKNDDVVFIGVNMDVDAKRFDDFQKNTPLPWPQVLMNKLDQTDINAKELAPYGASASLPRSFIIDQNGILVYNSVVQGRGERVVREVFERLL